MLITGWGVAYNLEHLPVLGLHAKVRDAPHQSTDKGRSAPVHAKNCTRRGQDTHKHRRPDMDGHCDY